MGAFRCYVGRKTVLSGDRSQNCGHRPRSLPAEANRSSFGRHGDLPTSSAQEITVEFDVVVSMKILEAICRSVKLHGPWGRE